MAAAVAASGLAWPGWAVSSAAGSGTGSAPITRPAQPWTSGALVISSQSLGAVRIGMTIAQAAAAAGGQLVQVGDGVYYPAAGVHLAASAGRGLSVLAGRRGTVRCVSASSRSGHPPAVRTAQGFPLGGTLAVLRAVYGSRLRFVPGPAGGGIWPAPGYVVDFPDGNLVFWVAQGKVDQIAGGPGMLPSIDCS
jgi:hypothetical protein